MGIFRAAQDDPVVVPRRVRAVYVETSKGVIQCAETDRSDQHTSIGQVARVFKAEAPCMHTSLVNSLDEDGTTRTRIAGCADHDDASTDSDYGNLQRVVPDGKPRKARASTAASSRAKPNKKSPGRNKDATQLWAQGSLNPDGALTPSGTRRSASVG